ncbi:dehydratase [Actinacidiphila yanglinensis]|uniref:Dehydratase n=1 Tax=Actinacidiphila yanglinensis TaxID=310779 RepID=A0A1H5V185_9ACTN|nr:cyclodehydratase [Actinacidiphila yanglinensis]SEF80996.1 dehydratase [Actinacidiphila yanglinensis]
MRTRVALPMALLGAVAALGLATGAASAADNPLTLACQATPPIVSAETFTIDAGVNGTAPATVAAGSAFTVTLAPDAITVPGSVNGNTVNSISSLKLTAPVPANATLNTETLSGGSGLGSGTPSVSVSGGTLTMTVPGPISGGSTFTLPTLDLGLTAGASGTTVQTQLAGSSYSSPGLTFTANVTSSIFTVNAPTACYPSPNPVLTTTTVS